MEGWIKLYRKITEWEWYTTPSVAHLFIYMLIKASTASKKWNGRTIGKGQLVTSIAALSDATGLSKATIRRSIEKLVKSGEILRETTNRYSLITIRNYAKFQIGTFEQSDEQSSEQSDEQSSEQHLKNKEYKNTRIPPPPPPAREENSEKRFYEALKGSMEMMNVMREEYGMTREKYWSLLDSFNRECTAKGKRHTSTDDYKRHFYDWTRRHFEINGKNEDKNKGKGYGNNKPDSGNEHGDNLSPKDRAIREANRRDRIAAGLDPDAEPTAFGSDHEF